MSPLDREAAAELPQSVLPATPEGYRMLNAHSALISALPGSPPSQPAQPREGTSPPTINNIHLNFYGNNHVYWAEVPAVDPGPHSVCTYAITTGGGAGNTLLGCRSFTVAG
jgi:hypothetical protein